jgi:tetratricopeptide (TPR) repeat protein
MKIYEFHSVILICAALLTAVVAGCGRKPSVPRATRQAEPKQTLHASTPDLLAPALAPLEGDEPADKDIRRIQSQIRNGQNRTAALEQLGWAFVAKAHASFDPGFFKLAEFCAKALDLASPRCPEGLLLNGHIQQNLHRFKEAETLARELVEKRGISFDFALLGDALMEQGRIKEAVEAYQSMVNIRPDLQSYARIAHIRWLTGDLEGGLEMMRAAAGAGSTSDPDSAAWVDIRLATLELQASNIVRAKELCAEALKLRPDYPPALLFRGKMLLAQGDLVGAAVDLELASSRNPLPEYQWALIEALHAAGRAKEAESVAANLRKHGAVADPRTYSLFLATHGDQPELAVRLAKEELRQRGDVFTHDALAWALAAAGHLEEARTHMAAALAEGTVDARLFFHAAMIASRTSDIQDARLQLARALALKSLLLPSEQSQLQTLADSLTSESKASNDVSIPAATNVYFSAAETNPARN